MPRAFRRLLIAALWSLLSAAASEAAEVRLIASDAQGVTLQLDVADFQLEAAGDDGRLLPTIPGLANGGDTGRPRLPFGRALLAIPPGTHAVARVISSGGESTRDNVRIAIYPRHGSQRDERLGAIPTLEPADPILDGAWPRTLVEVGEATTVRERHLVPVFLYPLRYDEITARLTLTRTITVRVEFTGAAARTFSDEPDPRHDGAFATRVLNWDQARTWRQRRPALREEASRTGLLGGAAALAAPSGPALADFEEDAPEVRVRIDSTGVYAVRYDSLALYGYPAGVPIAEVSVHRHEFVQDAAQPYVTYEFPREVEDNNGNNVFDAGDRIVLWVWNWAARSRATTPQRTWGDAEVIFVTRKPGAAGLAFAHRTGWLNLNGLTPLNSYPTRQRFRKITQYVAFPQDTAADQFLWTNFTQFATPDVFPYETNDIDNTKPETLTVNMQGTGNTQHVTWASTRNAQNVTTPVVTAATWSGLRFDARTAGLAPGAVSEGLTNTLQVWAQTNSGSGNALTFAGVHSFDLIYWRYYFPIQGYLSCNSGTETANYEILAGPFPTTAGLRVYDVSDSLNPVRLDDVHLEGSDPDFYARFQDTAAPGLQRDYVVCTVPRVPAGGAMSRVTRHDLWKNTSGDYLVVVPEGFQNAILPLVDLHSRQGMRVVVAPLEGIQDEFNGGRKSSYAIKRFVRYFYNRWNAQFVLLVGDGSEDPLHHMAFPSPDFVPVHKTFGPVPSSTGANNDILKEIVPSDTWFVLDLNGTGGVNPRPVPDLAIGRLPVSSVSQLAGVVDKIVRYDDLSGDQSWRRNVLLMADDQYSGVSTFDGSGSENTYCRKFQEGNFLKIDVVSDSLIRKLGGLAQTNVELFNMSYYLPNLGDPGPPPDFEYTTSGGADTCRNQRRTFQTRGRLIAFPALASRLNAGQMLWTYQGHANPWVMSHEDVYLNAGNNDDKNRLMNDGRPFVYMGFSCHPNAFARVDGTLLDLGPAFGEEFVTLGNNRGAVASYASVGFEAIPADFNNQFQTFLIKDMFVNPPRDELLGDRGARGVLGEILLAGMLDNYNGRIGNQSEQFVGISYALLGDPATRLSLGPPQSVVSANGVPVVSGQDVRLHTAGSGLQLDADLVSNVRLDSLVLTRTDASGTQVLWRSPQPLPTGLTLTPAFPDTALASAVYGGRRFHLTYNTQLIADTWRYTFRTVDRYGLATSIDAVFAFRAFLQLNGQVLVDGDIVAPTAPLSILVRSPKPLNPASDLTLTVDNVVQTFNATAASGDASGREWVLDWTHAPFTSGTHDARITSSDGGLVIMVFRVAEIGAAVQLRNVLAFPNPFDDDYLRALAPGFDIVTLFSFDLVTAAPADVSLRVYSISGRLIYERTERALDARYHQIGWNGRDAEGFLLANGVYIYRLLASNGTGTTMHEGRIVKLRRPRRVEPTSSATSP